MKTYATELKNIIDVVLVELCYGCQKSKSEPFLHNLCQILPLQSRVEFCLIHAIERVNHDKVMKTYSEINGLAVLEFVDAYDFQYRRYVWMNTEEWFRNVVKEIVGQYFIQ